MNRKINSIIAIVVSIIIIGIMLFLSLSKEKTQADIINEQLRKQNASWIAVDYSKDIMNIPSVYIEETEEDYITEEYKNYIFNSETKDKFIPEGYNYEDLIVSKNNKKTKISGLLFLTTNVTQNAHSLNLDDQLNWKEYFTPGKKQICGSCTAMGVTAGLEAYINRKYAINNNFNFEKVMFSPQYLISYTSFNGCGGIRTPYYLYFIHLNDSRPENINFTIKTKLKNQLNQINSFNVSTNNKVSLYTLIQYSIFNNEVPFGVPLEKDVPLLGYDSCEINGLIPNSNRTRAGMDLTPLNFISRNYFDKNFCPDSGDLLDRVKNIDNNLLYTPQKKNNINKHFIEYSFKVDANCRNREKDVQNIKEALTVSPLVATLNYYSSIYNYKNGIWEKPIDENRSITSRGNPSSHVVVISGWGIDRISGREYWILKNNWEDGWGDNSYLRTWIGDTDLNIECNGIYGFGGNLITKPGREINAIYDQIKFENENRDEIERQRIEKLENQNQPLERVPNFPNDINPLREYQMLNINYQDTKYISDKKCTNIMSCMSNKLAGFYGNNNQGNELT